MIRYSVLVPQRNAGEAVAQQLPELRKRLELLALPYEVICIDDASALNTLGVLEQMLVRHSFLRVLRLDRAAGLGASVTAGIAAARGEIIIVIGPGNDYPVQQIPHLIAALSRGDMAFGRRRTSKLGKAWQRVARLPRWFLLGLDVRDPGCLFWAARREAVVGIDLAHGMTRFLPSLVAMRGFRVVEVPIECERRASAWHDVRPNPGDLLTVWWMRRRYRVAKAEELRGDGRAAIKPVMAAASHAIDSLSAGQVYTERFRRRDSA